MALIPCPKCGKPISDTAFYCVHCGVKLKAKAVYQPPKKKGLQKWTFVVIPVIIIAMLGVTWYGLSREKQVVTDYSLPMAADRYTTSPKVEQQTVENQFDNDDSTISSNDHLNIPKYEQFIQDFNPVLEEQVSQVLYDDHDIFIEFRGLKDYYNKSAIVDLYFENNSHDELYIMQKQVLCNRVNLKTNSGLLDLAPDSIFMSSVKRRFVIDYGDLKEYGIKKIDSIDFVLEINKGNWSGEKIVELPVHLEVDYSIP